LTTRRVLIVEDDESMSIALRDGFEYEGYSVSLARDGEAGLELARSERPDLILLDVMLPRRTGLDLCRELRGGGDAVPIIMLTARGQEIDKVLGLKTGADDYITKPFGFMELLARAEAVLRRSGGRSDQAGRPGGAAAPGEPALETYGFADVTLDFKFHEARKGSRRLDLSPREFELMRFFIDHRGEVITRERLLDAVWDYNTIPLTRTVDMHIAKLRKKIEDNPADPCHIVTVHRLGYKFTG
jgi:two-component system alkaline phosphatase synthesis response regulator PhoP